MQPPAVVAAAAVRVAFQARATAEIAETVEAVAANEAEDRACTG